MKKKNTTKKYRWTKKVFFTNLIIIILVAIGTIAMVEMFLECLDYELSLSPRPDNAEYIVEKWME